eukprot:TRINITY_DN7871_c0_g1_i2.p1 TRINITY_DN7871_c0_g1~~TRINITY_DN7871_c0_g1_i2.p1  ORF type:complete len:378 (-),score=27.39 TRINITY_DN7871_c0_g1_i2:439-1572(-)
MPVGRSHPYARCSLEGDGVVIEAAAGNDDARPTSSSASGISDDKRILDASCLFPARGHAHSRSNEVALSVTQAPVSVGDVRMSPSSSSEFVFGSALLSHTSISPPQFGGTFSVDQQKDLSCSAESTADAQDNSIGRSDLHGSVFGRASLVDEPSAKRRLLDNTQVGSSVDSEMSEVSVASGFGDVSPGRSMLDCIVIGRSQPTDESLYSSEAYGSVANAPLTDAPATPTRRIAARGKFDVPASPSRRVAARGTSTFLPPPIFSNEPPPPLRDAIERNSEADVRAILLEDPSLATFPFWDHWCERPIGYATRMGRSERIIELLLENGADWSDAKPRRQTLSEAHLHPPCHLDYLQHFNYPIDLSFDWPWNSLPSALDS